MYRKIKIPKMSPEICDKTKIVKKIVAKTAKIGTLPSF